MLFMAFILGCVQLAICSILTGGVAQWECASHISSEDSDTKIAFFRRTNQGKTNFVRQSQQYLQNLVNISLLVLNHRCGFTAELPTSLSKKKFKGTQTKIWNLQLKSTFFVYFHNNTSTRHSEQHQNAVFCTMQYNTMQYFLYLCILILGLYYKLIIQVQIVVVVQSLVSTWVLLTPIYCNTMTLDHHREERDDFLCVILWSMSSKRKRRRGLSR